MTRTTLLTIAAAWTLFVAGCGGGDPEASGELHPVAGQNDSADEAPIDTSGAKSQIVRALLATLEEVKGDGEGAKNDLRRILLDADDELAASLGGNSKRLIMQYANRKPTPLVIGGPATPSAPPATTRSSMAVESVSSADAGDPGEPQTQIVRALLATLDEVKLEDDQRSVKAELRRSLIEADVDLRQILGDNSKRLILAANKKPVTPLVGTPGPVVPVARTSSAATSRPAKAEEPGKPQTPIVNALLDSLDQIDDEDESEKAALKRSLVEADVHLRQVLGANSKRLIIEHANKKAIAPKIPEQIRARSASE